MSSSSISPTPGDPGRRRLLRAGGALLLAGPVLPTTGFAAPDPLTGLRPWGRGEFHRFGLLIYSARLWVQAPPDERGTQPPYALDIEYHRRIAGQRLVDTSLEEMHRLGRVDRTQETAWRDRLAAAFPDVGPGDRIVGRHDPDGLHFFHNGQPRGGARDPALANAFFAIWLDARTRAPELRAALLQGPARS